MKWYLHVGILIIKKITITKVQNPYCREVEAEGGCELDVEVVQQRGSAWARAEVEAGVRAWAAQQQALRPGASVGAAELGALGEHVAALQLDEERGEAELPPPPATALRLHVHKLDAFPPERDALGGEAAEGACEAWALPHAELHGLWESLEYESELKEELLRFAMTALQLEALGVDRRRVWSGRSVLLHGPPGTGKTSLCRALAHKLAVRLAHTFPRARLLELNAHGLFSKWFSESGKIVTKLFDRIDEVAEDDRMLVVVLVDEVESLAQARAAAAAGLEPSDAIRAVNAVLAALDRLRRRPNALVLATSNVPAAVDAAFLDRADVKRLVPAPGARAAYSILRGACAELGARGALQRHAAFPWRVLEQARFAETAGAAGSLRLRAVAAAAAAHGVSGRALRRLPFLALCERGRLLGASRPDLPAFCAALQRALRRYLQDEEDLRAPAHAPARGPGPADTDHTAPAHELNGCG